jgi:hypothetical protein
MLLLMFKIGNYTGMDGFVSRKVHFPTIRNQKYPTNGRLRDKGTWRVLFFSYSSCMESKLCRVGDAFQCSDIFTQSETHLLFIDIPAYTLLQPPRNLRGSDATLTLQDKSLSQDSSWELLNSTTVTDNCYGFEMTQVPGLIEVDPAVVCHPRQLPPQPKR